MPVSRRRLRFLGKTGLIVLNLAIIAAVGGTAALIAAERKWATPEFREPQEAFRHGSIGTEVMPLPVAAVLPDLFPQHFQPAGAEAGDWIEQFGFLRDEDDPFGLPVGFTTTNYRPQSAAPSPVPFVALTCALCHTTEFRTAPEAEPIRLEGPGSVSLNLFAWLDAFQSSLIERTEPDGDYALTAADVTTAWEARSGESLDRAERLMISLWLRQIRSRIEDGIPRFDAPYGHGASRDEEVTPTGPSRTLAFRTLLRNVIEVPANDLPIHSKIATVYNQAWRERAQFDGTIADLDARSSMAALAAGATVDNMRHPEIVHNILAASDYTVTLAPPAFTEVFAGVAPPDPDAVARGGAVYSEHCAACHGNKADEGWQNGPRTGEVIPLSEIGTDPGRVMFRHYGEMPERLFALFPEDHPFAFERDVIYPAVGEEDDLTLRGYISNPIEGAFLRAPYLHNASVLTLAELINLDERRDTFLRGRNTYDLERVGFTTPDAPDADVYFTFDTALPGNSNAGHDYPWAWDDPERDPAALADLLAYLKTL